MDIIVSLTISILISYAGFFVIKEVFDRISNVSTEAKLIAQGDVNRSLNVKHQDEVGDLSFALNQLTVRIRGNIDELKKYGEKTATINFEIQKRIIVLSNLLQISSMISQNSDIEEILKLVTQKSRLLASSDVAYFLSRIDDKGIFRVVSCDGINSQYMADIILEPQGTAFDTLIREGKPLIIDNETVQNKNLSEGFYTKFRLKNTLALPVYSRGALVAIIGVGNTRENFSYKKDDIELLDIFVKQV
jgi:nitrate/nitrite-specific signal transduction histidine kinase